MPDLMWKSYSGIGSASIHNPVMKDQSNSKHKFHRLGSVLVKGQNAPDRIYVVKGTVSYISFWGGGASPKLFFHNLTSNSFISNKASKIKIKQHNT